MRNILFLHAGAELYGSDIVLYNILKGLDKNLFTPYVVLPNNGPLVDKIRNLGIFCEVIDYPILRRKYFTPIGILKYIINYKSMCSRIEKKIGNVNIDIIHNNTGAVLEGIYLKKKLNARLIFHIHEMIENPKFLRVLLSKLFAKYGNTTICVSRAVHDYLIQDAKYEDIRVIHNGIDNKIFHPNYDSDILSLTKKQLCIPSNSLVVGMIGRVNAIKGQDDFIKAITPVLKNHTNVYAIMVGGVFAGQEWRLEKLKEEINNLDEDVRNRVKLIEFREDNYIIHNLIDIYIFPSIGYDSFPTVILEAMASATPVIGYEKGGISEMIDDGINGYLVKVGDVENLSQKIEYLINNQSIRDEFSQKALLKQKNFFTILSQTKHFEKLYNE